MLLYLGLYKREKHVLSWCVSAGGNEGVICLELVLTERVSVFEMGRFFSDLN